MAVTQRARYERQALALRPGDVVGALGWRWPGGAWRSRGESFVGSTLEPLKVSLFGHFGSLNPGNESTLLAIVSRLRARYPESQFRCICTNPEAVVAREGIEAIAITTRRGIWSRKIPLAGRVPMAFAGVGAEL